MRIVTISDTHDHGLGKMDIPDGDVLIHAGDATSRGSFNSIVDFNKQLGKLPHKHKIITPGNHDWLYQREPHLARTIITNAKLLINEGTVIDGVKFWGSPVTPWFYDWAFNYQRGADIKKFWDAIPSDTDVLITHGPAYGIGDYAPICGHVGCEDLLEAVKRIEPRLHVFGHIHEGHGMYTIPGLKTKFINASICDEDYRPSNKGIVIDL